MTDRLITGQLANLLQPEDIGYPPHTALHIKLALIARNDTRRLLPPVLQSIEAEISQIGSFRMTEYANDPAFIMKMVIIYGMLHHIVILQFFATPDKTRQVPSTIATSVSPAPVPTRNSPTKETGTRPRIAPR